MSMFRDFKSSMSRNSAPATTAIVGLLILSFVLAWTGPGRAFTTALSFTPALAFREPWTFLTYPFFSTGDGNSLIYLLFLSLWLWGLGGWVERDIGTPRYVAVWLTFTFLCALAFLIGGILLGRTAVILASAWTPVAAITIIWGTRNPHSQVMLMFVLPILGKWLAWLAAALVIFATNDPMLAPFAAAPLALAYFFAADRLPFAPYRKTRVATKTRYRDQADNRFVEEVKRREKEREERERLRRLFENSVNDDPEDRKQDGR
jgi:membrane associated rhomboid family serine protease